jgi:hypothetical protein
MKYVWEESDVYEGRRVLSANKSEEFIIGYDPLRSESFQGFNLISLKDGMIALRSVPRSQLVSELNRGENVPKGYGSMKKFITIIGSVIFLSGCGPTLDQCRVRGDAVGKIVASIMDHHEDWDNNDYQKFRHKNGLTFSINSYPGRTNPDVFTNDPDWNFHSSFPSQKQYCIFNAYQYWREKNVVELKL